MMHALRILMMVVIVGWSGLALTACANTAPTSVQGYETLDLTGRDQAMKEVFDIAATYQTVQIVVEQMVMSPVLDDGAKTALKLADAQMVSTLNAYRMALSTYGAESDKVTVAMMSAIKALNNVAALIQQHRSEGA